MRRAARRASTRRAPTAPGPIGRRRSASRRIPVLLQRWHSGAVGMFSVIASSGNTGSGATCGPVRASTAGLRTRISASSRPSWRASASTRSATEAPVIRLPPVSVSMPMRISWACSAAAPPGCGAAGRRAGGWSARAAAAPPRGRHRCGRGGARPTEEGRRAASPPSTPRRRRAAGTGLRRRSSVIFLRISPARRRSMATCPSTQTTTSLAATSDVVAVPASITARARRRAAAAPTDRASSWVSGNGKVSATGPGP